jgi:hypothetical protein
MITDPAGIRERLEVVTKEAETRNAELKRRIAELEEIVKKLPGERGSDVDLTGQVTLKVGDSKGIKHVRANSSYNDVLSVFRAVCGPVASHIGYQTANGRYVWVRNDFDVKFLFTIYVSHHLDSLELAPLPQELIADLQRLNLRKEHAFRSGMPVFFVESAGPEGGLIWLSFPANLTFDAVGQAIKQICETFTEILFTDDSNETVLVDASDPWEYALAAAARLAPLGRFPLLTIRTA